VLLHRISQLLFLAGKQVCNHCRSDSQCPHQTEVVRYQVMLKFFAIDILEKSATSVICLTLHFLCCLDPVLTCTACPCCVPGSNLLHCFFQGRCCCVHGPFFLGSVERERAGDGLLPDLLCSSRKSAFHTLTARTSCCQSGAPKDLWGRILALSVLLFFNRYNGVKHLGK